ncbi:MAG: hypothetical protein V3T93_05075 [Alphaproteobacteria bacterium]
MEPFDRDDFVPWLGAYRMAMWGFQILETGKDTQRRHGANSSRPAVGRIGSLGSLRRSPDALHRASRRACPENRFAAIKLIPTGRIVL